MSTWLVTKRMNEDRIYLPGEILVDPDLNVRLLMERGHLAPVPDNFSMPSYTNGASVTVGNNDEVLSVENLMKSNRAELDALALEAGVEDPASLPSKRKVAEALLAKMNEGEA